MSTIARPWTSWGSQPEDEDVGHGDNMLQMEEEQGWNDRLPALRELTYFWLTS